MIESKEAEGKEQYGVEVPNRFYNSPNSVLGNLDDSHR
jgi:hypothetical protein